MDLINITTYIWNIFLLILFILPGTILESTEKHNNTKSIIKNLQLDLKALSSMKTTRKMSSTVPPTFSTALTLRATTPTKAILLSSITTKTATPQATTKSIKLLSSVKTTKTYTKEQQKQDKNYKRPKKMRREMKTTTDNHHEILKSNMTTTSKTTASTLPLGEHRKEEQQTKSSATSGTVFSNRNYEVQEHIIPFILQNSTYSTRYDDKTLHVIKNTTNVAILHKEMLANPKLNNKDIQNSLLTIFTSKPFVNFNNGQRTLKQSTMSNRSSINELYIDNPDINGNYTSSMVHQSNYNGNGQTTITLSTATKKNHDFNKSYHAIETPTTTSPTTTRKPLRLETKQNHMYDNKIALSYLPYQSAALKASATDMNTFNNNLNMQTSLSSGRSSSSSLKRDTLMSLAGIISSAKADGVDNSFFKNSTSIHERGTDDQKKLLKIQYNFESNNSLAHETKAMKQISQTTMKTLPATTITSLNEMSFSSSSSSSSLLPFNVSTTNSVISTVTTKEIPTTTATSTSRTILKTTTRRRKIPTTTLKPPPTIDDYQTITSQAGTHAYLPCNVKQLVKKPISWLRVRDGHILTVDQTTFIADQRFQSIYTTNPERWSLQIKYVQLKDAGIYECQVSTEPKASAIVYLHVVEPKTELIGAPTRHVKAGSQVKLLCIISQALEPPLFINWFYNQKQIYLHNRKGWHTEIERIELPPETTTTTTTTTETTTTTTTTAAPPLTSTTTTTSTLVPSSSTLSSTSSSMLNGSEISAMHVFTSITPQQSFNDGNLLELVSESTYNNYPNLIQPEAASISTILKTQQIQKAITTSTITRTTSVESTLAATSTTTSPAALPGTTTTLSFDEDNNDDDAGNDDNNDDDDNDDNYKTNPSATTFETAEAIAAGRGYMMLSSLMTFTDVKQITTASLIIPSVQKQDSGNYTCSPSNSEPRTVILHVLNGEYSASAITSAALNIKSFQYKLLIFNIPAFIFINNVLKNTLIYTQQVIRRYSGG